MGGATSFKAPTNLADIFFRLCRRATRLLRAPPPHTCLPPTARTRFRPCFAWRCGYNCLLLECCITKKSIYWINRRTIFGVAPSGAVPLPEPFQQLPSLSRPAFTKGIMPVKSQRPSPGQRREPRQLGHTQPPPLQECGLQSDCYTGFRRMYCVIHCVLLPWLRLVSRRPLSQRGGVSKYLRSLISFLHRAALF